MLSVLQAPSPPGASGLWASGYGYTNMPGWEKQGCGLTVPQFLCGDCPPTCPCPTVSFSAVHWGELLCIWAGRREFGWAVEAEEVPALCLHTLSCPQELVCVPMPSGGKRTAAFPWKTARCHKVKLGGSGELSLSADCWEDRLQTVKKFKEYLFSPVWKSRAGCFPAQHLWVETSQTASVSSSFWCETVSFKKKAVLESISAVSLCCESSSFLALQTCQCPEV